MMFWLFAARGMAHGMITGGLLGAAALAFTGTDGVWIPLTCVLVAGGLLPFIEREIRR